MIELKNISKTFHKHSGSVQALSGVSLQVAAGEIFGVIGASGAGKSTLIPLYQPTRKAYRRGEVIVDGRPLLTLTPRRLAQERRHIGMIFQHFNLLSSRTVHENVAFPLELSGTPRHTIDDRVNELLALVGLTEKSSEYPSSLSGGQNNAWPSPGPWPVIRRSCFATKPQAPWTLRRHDRSWSCSKTSTGVLASPSYDNT